jgi:hypothetical protein
MRDIDLIRIEHKLDLLISALQEKKLMVKSLPTLYGIEEDRCVVCRKKIKLAININEGVVHRNCGCALPKKAFKLTLIQNEDKKDANNRTEEDKVPSHDEE